MQLSGFRQTGFHRIWPQPVIRLSNDLHLQRPEGNIYKSLTLVVVCSDTLDIVCGPNGAIYSVSPWNKQVALTSASTPFRCCVRSILPRFDTGRSRVESNDRHRESQAKSGESQGAQTHRQKPPCRTHSSPRRQSTTSLTCYTIHPRLSGIAASSPNHGSRAPECTSSPTSSSLRPKPSNRGKRRSRILPTPPHFTPSPYPSTVIGPWRRQTRKKMVGSEPFLASCGWSWNAIRQGSLSLCSTGCHLF